MHVPLIQLQSDRKLNELPTVLNSAGRLRTTSQQPKWLSILVVYTVSSRLQQRVGGEDPPLAVKTGDLGGCRGWFICSMYENVNISFKVVVNPNKKIKNKQKKPCKTKA